MPCRRGVAREAALGRPPQPRRASRDGPLMHAVRSCRGCPRASSSHARIISATQPIAPEAAPQLTGTAATAAPAARLLPGFLTGASLWQRGLVVVDVAADRERATGFRVPILGRDPGRTRRVLLVPVVVPVPVPVPPGTGTAVRVVGFLHVCEMSTTKPLPIPLRRCGTCKFHRDRHSARL